LASEYHANAAQVVASSTCSQEYMPCEPSGLKITMIHVENPAMTAIAERLWASADSTASGQV
jgi:hypothetical protein